MQTRVYTREQDFYHYHHRAYEMGGLCRWKWYFQGHGEVECRLYIMQGSAWPTDPQTNDEDYYIVFGQAPGSNVQIGSPHDPPPVPDCQDQWRQLADLPYSWWEHEVLLADFHLNGTNSGFEKQPFPPKCFEADIQPGNCAGADMPVILHIVDL